MARKKKPAPGETCVDGHLDWVQYKDGMWYCRPCRSKNTDDYWKTLRATNREKYLEKRRRYQAATRARRKALMDVEKGVPE